MSAKPPPFAGYTPVSGDELWAKILSGEIEAHIYSSEAPGDFGPVPISAAAFSVAEAGRDEAGQPDHRLKPFQIMVRDRDPRRPSAARRAIKVPHWVYVVRTDFPVPERPKQRLPEVRTQARRDRVRMAAKALWPPSGSAPRHGHFIECRIMQVAGRLAKERFQRAGHRCGRSERRHHAASSRPEITSIGGINGIAADA